MITIFIFILIAVGLLTTKILHRYISHKKIPWYVYTAVWIGWFMCFGIVILVPIDILITSYRACLGNDSSDISSTSNSFNQLSNEIQNTCSEPYSYISPNALKIIYQTFYFGTLLLTWLVYPLLGSFVLAGDFTFYGKVSRSLRENAYLYLAFAVIGLILMIFLLIVKRLDWAALVGFAMAAANTWGLCLVIVLMGYGLVETPRNIWLKTKRTIVLKHLQYKAVDLLNSRKKANDELISTLKIIKKIEEKTQRFDPYEKYIKIIIEQCPPEYSVIQQGEGTGEVTHSSLVSLNSRLKNAIQNSQRSEFLYDQCLAETFELQDIMSSELNLDKIVHWSFKEPRTGRFAQQLDSFEWIWYNYLEIWVFRVSAIIFALLSVLVVYQEFALAVSTTDISVLSNITKHANISNFLIQFIVFFPLGYEALTTYSTLFKIKIFNYYRLIPHQHSDSNSIIFSAAYLCRLAAPLCYNFIQFIHLSNDTSFARVMGTTNFAPFLGNYFYIYFPVLIVIVCSCTLFNLYSRIMNCLKINRFRFDEEFSHDQIDEGKFLVDMERRKWTDNNIKPLSSISATPSSLNPTSNTPKQIFKSGSASVSKNSPPLSSSPSYKLDEMDNAFDIDDDIESSLPNTYNAHLSTSLNSSSGGSPSNGASRLSSSVSGFPSIFGNKNNSSNNKYQPLSKK
ncbi:hypothetical protein DICPUDRAFT_89023 [Dictyostelium purpureum]|uniref:Uncharacterized protein n=1 Tax=Dictyostelium purpureum TaxID=5786 RepID=F0ZT63_DICPU|nr:uncharacterized protein DICPUDRAFT_89023 [Dictyostelium purpureum]EGC32861.1 hypothetical protein DICPUDRAFT_89023 [Dictyostelium purpureum]|eukprot:XP_003290613.1 hypothetical protein DICPUDRAFT_89023 [Dictyostelium purpureum]